MGSGIGKGLDMKRTARHAGSKTPTSAGRSYYPRWLALPARTAEAVPDSDHAMSTPAHERQAVDEIMAAK
ncbi:MAG: hypothetical protein ACRDTE_12990 [Pseudonocardiaceae bacterium]